MESECRHIMPSGKQCRAHALRGEYFCFFHSQLHRAAKQPVSLIDSFDIPFLEDRCAVQLTITRVLRAFVNKTIDRQSTSTLLYGLQLALQSVDQGSWAIGFDTVEGISETQDGDEIAFDDDDDLEDDEDEIEEEENEGEEENEEEEEEEAPSDAASNPHDEGAGDPAGENDSENVEAEEDENESIEQLTPTPRQLRYVYESLEAGDMRPVKRLLGVGS